LQSDRFEVLLTRMNFRHFTTLGILLAATLSSWSQESDLLTNAWTYLLPDEGTASSPALAPDGTVYQGTFHGWLIALKPTGKVKWKFKAEREIKSSPAVAADGTIGFGSRDNKFYALTPRGKLKWAFVTGAWVDSSPAIAADGTFYFGSWDGFFYALNSDGLLRWKFATGNIIVSSPAIAADGTIYFGSHDKKFYALTPDGKLKWSFATGAEITASPAIAAEGAVYFSSTDGNLYALNPDGTERWRVHTGGYTSASPVLDESGNLYLAVNRERYSVAPDHAVRWHFSGNNLIDSSSATLSGGRLFTSGPWTQSGLLTSDSNFIWNFSVGYGFFSSANVSPQGVIYIADQHYLYAFGQQTNAAPPVKSSWALWRANPQHTGRVTK
jgi:outer membrane protein assembly factor BamB